MPKAERVETFSITAEKFYNVIIDYSSYPEFVDGVSSIEVLESSQDGALVKYSLNLIKTFTYILRMTHHRPNRVSWVLESGDIFKKNEGYWELQKINDEETKVTYGLDIEIKLFAPKAILNKLVTKNLPNMMKAYYEKACE